MAAMAVTTYNTEDRKSPGLRLELLPPEVLLQILRSFPSLDTLWNLLRASPICWGLFNSHSVTITEDILSGPNSIMPPKIQALIRAVALVRSGTPPFSCDEFKSRFVFPWTILEIPHPTFGPYLLPKLPDVLRSLVVTAYHISALSQARLVFLLDRLRDPSFRPLHAVDPKPQYQGSYGLYDQTVRPWDRRFPGSPVSIVNMGQPTWLEEMRVVRAMWTMQLMGDMLHLVATKRPISGWPTGEFDALRDESYIDLFGYYFRKNSEREEFQTVLECLPPCDENGTYFRLPRAPPPSVENRWVTMLPKTGQKSKWEDTADAIDLPTYGLKFYSRLRNYRTGSPIPSIEFDSFRRLGFALWDRRRLHLLGLAPGLDEGWHTNDFYFFAWESILPPEEVDELKISARSYEHWVR